MLFRTFVFVNVVHVVSTSAASIQDDLDYLPKLMSSLRFLCRAYSSCKVPSPFHFGNIIIFKVQIFSFQYFFFRQCRICSCRYFSSFLWRWFYFEIKLEEDRSEVKVWVFFFEHFWLSMLCMFLSVLQQLPFKMAQITVLTKINTSPALLMSSIQGTDLLFLRFAFLSMSCTFLSVLQ